MQERASSNAAAAAAHEAHGLGELSPQQWRSGAAAWLGWLFDGLDMHLYTLVATPFVAQLLLIDDEKNAAVGYYASVIQASFLVGWAVGGAFFGRLGDRLGRSRTLALTILTYAAFTGLSFAVQTWWQLMICRFLAALGIGGEWAVGAALLSETWPKRWRHWTAAVLQSAVDCGMLLAMLIAPAVLMLVGHWQGAGHPYRYVFLVGVLPALIVQWIRRAVPETGEWHAARLEAGHAAPRLVDLFGPRIRRTTLLTMIVCALALTANWAFMYWFLQHLNNLLLDAGSGPAERTHFKSLAMILLMFASIVGNFVAAAIARRLGYRRTIALLCLGYFAAMVGAYGVPRSYQSLLGWLLVIGVCKGHLALFTMYLPPLFPTLLRTTGAGFCYNIGRIAAAGGTVFFGLFSTVGDHRMALVYSSTLFVPAAILTLLLPELSDKS